MEIKVEVFIDSDIKTVWQAWNTPEDIKKWNAASDDWHTTASAVDLREGGKFSSRMEAKDGSQGFDFSGTYTRVIQHQVIETLLDDGRSLKVEFREDGGGVWVVETFEAESTNTAERQRQGWQAILDSFSRYVQGKQSGKS